MVQDPTGRLLCSVVRQGVGQALGAGAAAFGYALHFSLHEQEVLRGQQVHITL